MNYRLGGWVIFGHSGYGDFGWMALFRPGLTAGLRKHQALRVHRGSVREESLSCNVGVRGAALRVLRGYQVPLGRDRRDPASHLQLASRCPCLAKL